MNDDALSGAVSREELQHFKGRHPAFRDAVARLKVTLEAGFLREMKPRPDKSAPVQPVVFFLGHQAADDFFEILLLAVHGYGFGALKLPAVAL